MKNYILNVVDNLDTMKANKLQKIIRKYGKTENVNTFTFRFVARVKIAFKNMNAKEKQTFSNLASVYNAKNNGVKDINFSRLNTLTQSFETEQRAAKSMLNNALNRGKFQLHFSKMQYLQQLSTIDNYSNFYTNGRLDINKIFNSVNKLCRKYYV